MKTYNIYGYAYDKDIQSARNLIENSLGIRFKGHESSYLGIYYKCGITGTENFVLQYNYDEFEKEWMEPDHQSYPILLYINATSRASDLEEALIRTKRFTMIKHEKI